MFEGVTYIRVRRDARNVARLGDFEAGVHLRPVGLGHQPERCRSDRGTQRHGVRIHP